MKDNLTTIAKQPTCNKAPNSPTCIDLILTNLPRGFESACVIEAALSSFHSITLTVMKHSLRKFQPTIVNYKSYKKFSNEILAIVLGQNLKRYIYKQRRQVEKALWHKFSSSKSACTSKEEVSSRESNAFHDKTVFSKK